MSTDTDRLEHEAERHRSNVDSTIDQLRDRFSVGQIVDELTGYAKEGQGADMARNLGRQVRDNPLALGLVGAGIAWLLMGDSMRDQGHRLRSRYGDWRDHEDDRFERAFPPGSSGARYSDYQEDMASDLPARGGGSRRPAPYPLYGEDRVGHTGPSSGSSDHGPGMAERARGMASSVGSGISGAASSAGSTASHAGHATADAARRAGSGAASMGRGAADAMGHAAHDARDAAYRAGDAVYRGGAYAGRRAYGAGRRVQRTFLDTLQEEPLVMGAVAVAIGAAIGAALPATRREDEWLGEARDRFRDEAYEYGRDTLHRAEHVAEEAFKAADDEAGRKGLKPSGDGETIAEKVSDVAKAATEAAKSESKKEGLI